MKEKEEMKGKKGRGREKGEEKEGAEIFSNRREEGEDKRDRPSCCLSRRALWASNSHRSSSSLELSERLS
jgi:hypothetical protein